MYTGICKNHGLTVKKRRCLGLCFAALRYKGGLSNGGNSGVFRNVGGLVF